ncbi:SRPBCC family protein [Limnoraphis robusta Tam1]|uniref:SRPBCC family protein n=1 Tax=Limnoraphis robusta CCNP1315 TaxID=3110306 RepID=A0ABU5TZE9_9CYAN|nr:SRPBCC family protein [Limnoraphis robusta]MEA5500454.1 SRPBCC family protein [Limnoraphis robusta BA-68 BA1]MEA5520280.1 SRPBCC family protein [Limnoraphis robusta CCNP1315]MEA5537828.1 SRPBCC family protein [Limnoraphis robusta Tam1]MEA5548546.1 SRPBCC family protein [Limnoraphis robusta CCNP1324]
MEKIIDSNRSQQPSENTAGDTERWASLVGGSALVLMGLKQRSLRGILMSLVGGGLVFQGAKNQSTVKQVQQKLDEATEANKDQRISVEKTVIIDKPAEELYNYWRNFENLPTFTDYLQSVTVYDEQRSHWVAKTPVIDTPIEWDALVVNDCLNELIAWTSVEGADIDHSGFVRFRPATGGRGTEVKVVMEYNPPGGAMTANIAKLFGAEPEQQLGQMLSRFKQLMEAGEIATTEGQPQGS